MTDLDAVVTEALQALGHARPLAGADGVVPGRPGMYAIYADATTWKELELGKPTDERPLYIGKAEDSLVARDLKTHFSDGRTGQSTVRRSFAALLHDTLRLRGVPRNTANPGYFSNYGLVAAHDAALTRWMKERLELAVWPKPAARQLSLGEIEAALLTMLEPPLNLQARRHALDDEGEGSASRHGRGGPDLVDEEGVKQDAEVEIAKPARRRRRAPNDGRLARRGARPPRRGRQLCVPTARRPACRTAAGAVRLGQQDRLEFVQRA